MRPLRSVPDERDELRVCFLALLCGWLFTQCLLCARCLFVDCLFVRRVSVHSFSGVERPRLGGCARGGTSCGRCRAGRVVVVGSREQAIHAIRQKRTEAQQKVSSARFAVAAPFAGRDGFRSPRSLLWSCCAGGNKCRTRCSRGAQRMRSDICKHAHGSTSKIEHCSPNRYGSASRRQLQLQQLQQRSRPSTETRDQTPTLLNLLSLTNSFDVNSKAKSNAHAYDCNGEAGSCMHSAASRRDRSGRVIARGSRVRS